MKAAFALLVAAAALAGCRDRDKVGPVDTLPSATPRPEVPVRSAYLSVSNLEPEIGANVIVSGVVSVDGDLSLGSYRVRLVYDTTRLTFIDEVPSAGMMRVVNPTAGEIIVAGASSGAAEDGRLFTLRFRVENPAGLNSLLLHVDELNDASFASQASAVTRSSRLVLDRSLALKSANPR